MVGQLIAVQLVFDSDVVPVIKSQDFHFIIMSSKILTTESLNFFVRQMSACKKKKFAIIVNYVSTDQSIHWLIL